MNEDLDRTGEAKRRMMLLKDAIALHGVDSMPGFVFCSVFFFFNVCLFFALPKAFLSNTTARPSHKKKTNKQKKKTDQNKKQKPQD